MSQEAVIGILAVAIGALLAIGLILFRQLKRESYREFIERIAPEKLRPLAEWAAMKAYDAVEQIANAYGDMSNEEKQALATEWATKIYEFLTTGELTEPAAKALLEAQIYASKQQAQGAGDDTFSGTFAG